MLFYQFDYLTVMLECQNIININFSYFIVGKKRMNKHFLNVYLKCIISIYAYTYIWLIIAQAKLLKILSILTKATRSMKFLNLWIYLKYAMDYAFLAWTLRRDITIIQLMREIAPTKSRGTLATSLYNSYFNLFFSQRNEWHHVVKIPLVTLGDYR